MAAVGSFNFSLRRYEPDQVQRVYLNSFQNTPKANPNVRNIYKSDKYSGPVNSPSVHVESTSVPRFSTEHLYVRWFHCRGIADLSRPALLMEVGQVCVLSQAKRAFQRSASSAKKDDC